MTDTVIVAIIGGGATVIAAALGVWAEKRKKRAETEAKSKPLPKQPADEPQGLPAKASETLATRPTPPPEPGKTLTHAEISRTIESAPPFHRDSIHDSFVGQTVSWTATLGRISSYREVATVYGTLPGHCIASFKSPLENAKIFIASPEGTSFRVTGKIEYVDKYSAELSDCEFSIQPAAPEDSGGDQRKK